MGLISFSNAVITAINCRYNIPEQALRDVRGTSTLKNRHAVGAEELHTINSQGKYSTKRLELCTCISAHYAYISVNKSLGQVWKIVDLRLYKRNILTLNHAVARTGDAGNGYTKQL